ncbi:MAG: hypothetical protein AAGG01_17715, partial [Planctomycetota bacterium]
REAEPKLRGVALNTEQLAPEQGPRGTLVSAPGLGADERARVVERADRLAKEAEQLESTLGEEERAALARLPEKERRRVLRNLLKDRARLSAARVRKAMTAEEREAFAKAAPEERAVLLRAVRKRELSRLPERLERLGAELGLSTQELKRIESGDRASQRSAIAGVVRRRVERQVKEGALPESVTPGVWERLRTLDDREFLRAVQRLRLRAPELGIPKKRWEGRLRRREGFARRLEAMGQPGVRERVRHPAMREHQLRVQTVTRKRKRIEDVMIGQMQLSLDLAARLRSLDDKKFVAAYRFAIKVLKEGGDVESAFRRWMERPHARRAK